MNTNYGVWTPLSGALPDVKDLDFGAFYITESGSLSGDSTSYIKDNWLIYICEARGTLSERSYWRVTNGVVLFNPDSHTNVPDAGYYTKIRLDNAGNIVAAGDIEYDDLPAEAVEKFEQISDDNLNKLIAAQLASIFKNNSLNPIQLKYDSKTGKIGATLQIDEETIGINDLGQLCVIGSSEGSGSSSTTVDLSAVTTSIEELEERVETLEEAVVQIKPIQGKGISISVQKGGSVISAKIDEESLTYNSEGQLCVNPDVLAEYLNSDSDGSCANHTHNASQIEDLAEYVTKIINTSSITDVVKSNLENVVDGTTIILNSSGQLEAIATNVQKHQHVMDDISDLNQNIANVWASNQRLHASNDNQDFNKGAILMSSLTIGEVLIAFNELLKEQADNLSNYESKLGTIEPVEPGLINTATFSDVSEKITAFDVVTEKEVSVSKSTTVISTSDVIYFNGSVIHAYIDDKEVESFKAYDDSDHTFGLGTFGNFTVTYFGDAYPKFKTFQGYYKGFSFQYNISSLQEGIHTVYFTQENVNDGTVTKSDTVTFNTITSFTPTAAITFLSQPDYNGYVSGVKVFKGTPEVTFQVAAKNFSNRFAPIIDNTYTVLNNTYTLKRESTSGGMTLYKAITVDVDDYYGNVNVKASIGDWEGKYTDFENNTIFINVDNSTEEAYRVVQEQGDVIPTDSNVDVFSVYNPADSLLDKYDSEAQVKDHCLILAKTDYSSNDLGPDYSNKTTSQMLTLRFECPQMNNFYFDLYDDEGNEFATNKNGSISGLSIYAGIAPSTAITKWVDCNTPYVGYGHWDSSKVFNALDLFRTEGARRWVTFGKDGDADSGYLYLKLITTGKAVNLQKLIASVEECLDERR